MTATTAGTETAAADAETTLDGFEMVVGLEVHVELATATKLFSSSPNRFGDEPNTNIDPVTLGLPGSLPVLNRRAVELAVRIGLALHCEVRPCLFHRKNYFYPDMPKDYQISQYDQPLNVDGWLELPSGKRIGIERAHMEEDTGKSTHIGGAGGRIHGSDYSLVDYNRAGVPLVEIVGRPDIANAEEARQYVNELRAILVAIDASDAKMEEGSMRVDANVSVRRPGEPYGTRCEVKNLNSVRSLGRAIEYEARRQVQLITGGETVRQETRHWDENDGRTHTLRTKEDADDYRYFPEPDLVPLVPDPAWVEEIRDALPPLPAERRARLSAKARVDNANEAVAIAVERGRDALASAAIDAGGDPSPRARPPGAQPATRRAGPGHRLCPRRPDPTREGGQAHRHPGEAGAGRSGRGRRRRRSGRSSRAAGLRGDGVRRAGVGRRRCHRRATRRLGQVLRGRGQGRRRAGGRGDEVDEGPGRRRGGHCRCCRPAGRRPAGNSPSSAAALRQTRCSCPSRSAPRRTSTSLRCSPRTRVGSASRTTRKRSTAVARCSI